MKKHIEFIFAVLILSLANAASAVAQSCAPAPVGLVSWWSADGNALDSRSRNNGTLQNGATFGLGQNGQAFSFDGVNDFVAAPDSAALNAQRFTMESWVFPTSYASGGNPDSLSFIMNKESATATQYLIGIKNNFACFNGNGIQTGNFAFYIDGLTGLPNDCSGFVNGNANLPVNIWSHVALTYDGANVRTFVNGSLTRTIPATGTITSGNGTMQIGGRSNFNTSFLQGRTDEPTFYNRALSASEIQAVFNAGTAGKCKPTATAAPSGQTAWFAGNGNANDIAGTSSATLQGGTAFAVGKVGQTFSFDGNDDSVQLSLNQSFQNFTLESWVKPLSAVNDSINQELILGQAGFGAQMVVRPGTNGGMRVVVSFRDTINSFAQIVSTNDIPLGDWSHLVGTFDGTTLKLYINGVLNAQLNPPNTTVLTCNTPYFIGGFQSVTDCNSITNQPFQFFNGHIDEASIYNRALTDAEIQSIFNAGIAGKLKQNQTIDTGSLVSLWQGETNANDTRGANNGAFTGNYAAGKAGQAFQINDQLVAVADANSLDFTNAYTIEMWVAPSAIGTAGGTAFLACKGNCSFANNQPYSLLLLDTRQVVLTVGSSSAIDRLTSNSALPLNSFSHVVGTYDGATMRIYINGVLDNTKTTPIGTVVNSSDPFVFGGSNQFGITPGIYDEVALYNRTLSSAEVRANYEAGNALSTVVGDARVTFPNVSTAGTTQQIPLDLSLLPPLPNGATSTGLTYDIATSASFSGSPTVCFNLPSFTDSGAFANLRILHLENNLWISRTDLASINFATKTICTNGLPSLSPFAIVNAPFSAANASVSGQVRTAGGSGIRNAVVRLSNTATGTTQTVQTGSFGRYDFTDLAVGQTYILSVEAKRYTINDPTRFINLTENVTDVDFISENK